MKRFSRVGVALGALAVAVLTVLGLTYVGNYGEGPLGSLFTGMGTAVSTAETRVVQRFRVPERRRQLAWFAPMRTRAALARPDTVLLGAFDSGLQSSFEGLGQLETGLGAPLPLVHVFTAWGDADEQQFPRRLADAIWEAGSVPVVTWEPWLSAFDAERHDGLPPKDTRDMHGLAAVAKGDYDFYLRAWAQEAAEYGHPLFLRFAHEMNDAYRYPWGPHQNKPPEYVAAFRHVVEVFRAEGAANVLWVWSPHLAYDFEAYYPGDDVVDWVGATVLNYGTVAYWSQWWTFDDVFTRKYDRLAVLRKPIMIAELGTIMAGGERAPWYEQALTGLPRRLPEVKAVVFFHNHTDKSITYQALDWAFADDTTIVAAIRRGLATWRPAPVPAPAQVAPGAVPDTASTR